MKKICICIMSRMNYGRLKSVCKAVNEHPDLQLQIIVGASAAVDRWCHVDFNIDSTIQCLVEGDNTETMTLTTGLLLIKVGQELERLKPDIVLVHGDRHEVLAAAIAASYMNIPLAHTEGGERSGTIDNKVRDSITTLADIHFPTTENARNNIIKILGSELNVYNVGSTALDTIKALDYTTERKKPYLLIVQHPNTTDPEPIEPLIEALSSLPFHKVWVNPNVDAGYKNIIKKMHSQPVECIKNIPPEEYAKLLYNCECAIGNSSSFIKEGAFLGVYSVIIGKRQENREHSDNVLHCENKADDIIKATEYSLKARMGYGRPTPSYRFGNGTASEKIVNILKEM